MFQFESKTIIYERFSQKILAIEIGERMGRIMLYQNLLIGIEPYSVSHDVGKDFPQHVHYELELILVVEGRMRTVVNGTQYDINEGEVVGIGSMVNHSYINLPEKTRTFIVEFGPVFIGEKYKFITQNSFDIKIYKPGEHDEIIKCMRDIIKAKDAGGEFSSMMIRSLLYRLFVLVAEDNSQESATQPAADPTPQREEMSKVQNALNLVHHRYKEPLTINDAAAACGYGKSVFCKVFKNAVGVGFHQYLNAHRIEIAKYLLSETTTPIDCIADTVGYKDTKTFYRLFKATLGMSPGEYRKMVKML